MKKAIILLFISLFVFNAKTFSQVDLLEGLKLYLPFNESIVDESNLNNEVVVFEASLGEDCMSHDNSALYFDGVDDYLLINNSSELDFETSEEFSIAFWFKAQNSITQNGSSDIISKWNSALLDTPYSYTVRISTDASAEPGIIKATRFDGNSVGCNNVSSVSSESGYMDNEWHHLVYQLNSANVIELYLDAELVSSMTDQSTCNLLSPSDLIFGDRTIVNNNSKQPYKGAIDEVRFYDRFLNASEIDALFNKNTSVQDTIAGCLNLNFENIEGFELVEGAEISDQFEASFGLTFELEGGGFPVLAEVGGDEPVAFSGPFASDTPDSIDAEIVGNFFLTDDGLWNAADAPPVILNFARPIDNFSGCILDMDGEEVFHIEAFGEFGDVILEDSIVAGDPGTGDGRATCWGFEFGNCIGMVYQIKFSGTRPLGAFGLGLDNFSFCYAGVTEALDYVICEGDSIIVNDIAYSESGTYEQQFTTASGCDSLVFIVLDVVGDFEVDANYGFCDGESIEINGIIYNEPGEYEQLLESSAGCDSLVNIFIEEYTDFFSGQDFIICEGDSIVINGEIFTESGLYTQEFITTNGCDSIYSIAIQANPTFSVSENFILCEGDSIEVNGTVYNEAGVFEEVFTTFSGCDSIATITIELLPSIAINIEETICDNENFELNGTIYASEGNYTVQLENSNGCDSIINLNLIVLPIFESFESYTIFEGESVTVNGEDFSIEGDYIQVFTANNSCDSTVNIELIVLPPPNPETIVFYDLDNCDAGNGYAEMTPSYPSPAECLEINASVFSRPSGLQHSCTPGNDGGEALCISSLESCDYDADSEFTISFQLNIEPQQDEAFVVSNIGFFEKAPEAFVWTYGGSGPNNYPTLFGIRILRDNVEIFSQSDINTNRNWFEQIFEFEGNDNFRFEQNGTLTVELLPYCVIGNTSTITAWDLDQIAVKGYCSNISSRLYGQIRNAYNQESLNDVDIKLSSDGFSMDQITDENGLFAFNNLIEPYEYSVNAYNNKETMNGVSTLDLVLIQRHILGIKPFENTAQYLAADINKSNSITAIDLIELRKLILGIYEEFPNNTSWRFFDKKDMVLEPFTQSENILANHSNSRNLDFEGVKIGDVNDSMENLQGTVSTRSNDQIDWVLDVESNEAINQTTLHFSTAQEVNLLGFQMALDLSAHNGLEIIPGKINVLQSNVNRAGNEHRISWNEKEIQLSAKDHLFSIKLNGTIAAHLRTIDNFKNELYHLSNQELLLADLNLEMLESREIQDFDFRISPNPANQQCTIILNQASANISILEIFDISGRKISSKSIDPQEGANTIFLDRRDLGSNPGLRYITIQSDNQSLTKKLVLIN